MRKRPAPKPKPWPDRLRALRAALGLTQEQLARRVPCSWSAVARWEVGDREPSGLYRRRLERLERSAQTRGGK